MWQPHTKAGRAGPCSWGGAGGWRGPRLAPLTGTSGRHWSGRLAPRRVPAQGPGASLTLSLHFVFQPSAGPAQPHRGVRATAASHVPATAAPLTSSPGSPLDAGVPTVTPRGKDHRLMFATARAVCCRLCPGVRTRSGRSLRGGPAPGWSTSCKTLLPQVDVF